MLIILYTLGKYSEAHPHWNIFTWIFGATWEVWFPRWNVLSQSCLEGSFVGKVNWTAHHISPNS
jgi:hypothetical protein